MNNVLLCQTSRASRQRHRWSLNNRWHYWHRNRSTSWILQCQHAKFIVTLRLRVKSGLGDGDCWLAALMVLVASRGRQLCTTSVVLVASQGRQWCWWQAGTVGGAGGWPGSSVVVPRRRWYWWLAGSSVVLVASRGRQLWYLASVVLVAGRGHRWCWWLSGVIGGAGGWPGRQLWYPASVVLVAGRHHQGCLLRSGPWSLNLLWSWVAPLILLSQRQSCNGAV